LATILPFSTLADNISSKSDYKKALLDTCALISFSHDTNEFHDETLALFAILKRAGVKIFSNVNIRSEFIDYQRRIIVTEALTAIGGQVKGIFKNTDLAKRIKAHVANVHKRAESGNPLVLNDSNIKQFKKLISISHGGIKNIWLNFCANNLAGRLEQTFDIVQDVLKLSYLSMRKGAMSPEVISEVTWDNMYSISEKTGLGVDDSMILNMFNSTDIPILVTTDFDLVYASAIEQDTKLVFCPNRIYADFNDKFSKIL
jgi:predicted nucleic acid-binding protein